MARPPVLPLPDSSVRHIIAHVDELRSAFPVSQGTRPFIAAFLRLVHEATGEIYGASTMRKLLQTYANEYRPSTTTIQKEIKLFRESLNTVQSTDIETTAIHDEVPKTMPAHSPDVGQLTSLIAGLQRSLEQVRPAPSEGNFHNDALANALQAENKRLRAYAENLVRMLDEARQEKLQAINALESVKAERDTYKNVSNQLSNRVTELAEAVKRADERTDASHRFALGRIEDATAELRRYKELLEKEKEKTAAVENELRNEQAMSDALRQALNAQRSKSSKQTNNQG